MKRIVIWTASLVLAGACSLATAADELRQTRVAWLPSCPSDPQPVIDARKNRVALLGLLVAAVAPKLIEGAVDTAAEALKAAGQTKTFVTTAKSATDFYSVSQDADLAVEVNCLVIVRGVFDETKSSTPQWAQNSDEFKGLQSANFQVEAKLKPLRGLKYFQLVPQYLKVGEFDEHSVFSRKDRDYVAAVTFTVPGAAQPFGSAEMTFKDVVRDTELKGEDWRLRSAATLPIAFPTESADATKAKEKREAEVAPYLLALDILSEPTPKPFGKAPDLYEDPDVSRKAKTMCDAIEGQNRHLGKEHQVYDYRCTYPLAKVREDLETALEERNRNDPRKEWAKRVCTYVPADPAKKTAADCSNRPTATDVAAKTFTYFTTQLTLSETREGSKFALYLGNALSSSKADVSAALQAKLLPKTQAEKDSEATTARAARTGVLVADLEVTKAEAGLADALLQDPAVQVDIADARIKLLKAKIAANDAHRKAGMSVPYPEID
ncbi:hypothetical protein [Cupriavidus sp. BIC8F]|uniref:hypothetical protein n=1 Tax=Cupriavidus sp. BIC8F TaxID=3079014 RepID=UPI0029167D6E|nr:hypothetical protein [Cupriavidus sp. BIC8F]